MIFDSDRVNDFTDRSEKKTWASFWNMKDNVSELIADVLAASFFLISRWGIG